MMPSIIRPSAPGTSDPSLKLWQYPGVGEERGALALAPTRRHSDGSDDRPLSVTKQARTRETSDRGRNTRSPGPSLFDDFLQPLKTINTNSRYYWGVNQQLEKWVALKRCRETKQSYTRYCFYTSMKKSCCI